MNTGSCARTRGLLPLYVEGEASPAEAFEAASHLAGCAACSTEESRDRSLLSALKSMRRPDPPRDIARGVTEALRKVRERLPAARALKWSAISLLVVLLLLDCSRSDPGSILSLQLVVRLGELMNLDAVVGRLSDLFAKLLPAPSQLPELALGTGAALAGGSQVMSAPAVLALFVGATLLLLVAGCLLAFGGAIVAGPALDRRRRLLRRF